MSAMKEHLAHVVDAVLADIGIPPSTEAIEWATDRILAGDFQDIALTAGAINPPAAPAAPRPGAAGASSSSPHLAPRKETS